MLDGTLISALTEATAVAAGDYLVIVDDPNGTPVTKRIRWDNVLNSAVLAPTVVIGGEDLVLLQLNADTTAQTTNILETYDSDSALRAVITADGEFSNTQDVTGSEAFGAGAVVTDDNSVAFGEQASAGFSNAVVIGRLATITEARSVSAGAGATAGLEAVALGQGAGAVDSSVAIGRTSQTTAANQLVIGSATVRINEVYFGKGVLHGIPTAFTLSGTGGSGTDVAGGNVVARPGISTGAATPASFIVQATAAIGTGSTPQTPFDAVTVSGTGVVIGNYGAAVVPLTVNAHASQTANLSEWYNGSAALRARITAAGEFSNTGGQTASEIFGASASVTGTNALAAGFGAIAAIHGTAVGKDAKATSSIGFSAAFGALAHATGGVSFAFGRSVTVSGSRSIGIGNNITVSHGGSIVIGDSFSSTATGQLIIGSSITPLADVYLGRGVTHATPTSITINPTGGLGTDIGGADIAVAAGRSTGAGAPGSLLLQAAIADAGTGTTLNGLSTGYELTADATELLMAWFGVSAVGQQAHPGTASGTDAAVINAIRNALINYGLLAAA